MAMLLVSWYWYGTITSFRRIGVRQTDCSLVREDRLIARVAAPTPKRARTVSVVGRQAFCWVVDQITLLGLWHPGRSPAG